MRWIRRSGLAVLFLTFTAFACAGDAEDSRDIVGYWKGNPFLLDSDLEFKADGTYRFIPGAGGKWRISNGTLIFEGLFGVIIKNDYTLARDSLVLQGTTRTRRK